jgi:hypothetical protein
MCSELSHSLEITPFSTILDSNSLPRMQGVFSLYFTTENIAHNFATFSLQINFHRPKELSSGSVVKDFRINRIKQIPDPDLFNGSDFRMSDKKSLLLSSKSQASKR